jgi:hypothetical protein
MNGRVKFVLVALAALLVIWLLNSGLLGLDDWMSAQIPTEQHTEVPR